MAAYSVSFTNVTATTGGVMAMTFINPAASPSCSLKMIRCWMGQSGTATSAQLNVKLIDKATAFPTLTSATPKPLHNTGRTSAITGGTAGAAGTAGTNASVQGAGTETLIIGDVFNNLNGYLWVPQINDPILFDAGSSVGFGMVLATTPSVLTNWSGGTNFDEV